MSVGGDEVIVSGERGWLRLDEGDEAVGRFRPTGDFAVAAFFCRFEALLRRRVTTASISGCPQVYCDFRQRDLRR